MTNEHNINLGGCFVAILLWISGTLLISFFFIIETEIFIIETGTLDSIIILVSIIIFSGCIGYVMGKAIERERWIVPGKGK